MTLNLEDVDIQVESRKDDQPALFLEISMEESKDASKVEESKEEAEQVNETL